MRRRRFAVRAAAAVVGCLLGFLSGASASTKAPDPMAPVVAELERQGFKLRTRAEASAGDARLIALAFRDAGGYGRLRVYEIRGKKGRLIHIAGGGAAKLDLDARHAGGKWPRLWGEATPFLLYAQELSAMQQSTFHILRYRDGKLEPVSQPLPMGSMEDVDSDGKPEVLSRTLPLGTFFAVECEETDFRTMARSAYRTAIYDWNGAGLVAASARHAAFFDKDIARLEAELDSLDPRKTERYGAFLATSLSIYFDHAEKGERRAGWERFAGIFKARQKQVPPLPSIRRRLEHLRDYIRRRLEIPDDWPD